MAKSKIKTTLISLLICCQSFTLLAQGKTTIYGTAFNRELGIPGIIIELENSNNYVASDENGNYRIEIPDSISSFKLSFQRIGFLTKEYQFTRDSVDKTKFTITLLKNGKN